MTFGLQAVLLGSHDTEWEAVRGQRTPSLHLYPPIPNGPMHLPAVWLGTNPSQQFLELCFSLDCSSPGRQALELLLLAEVGQTI